MSRPQCICLIAVGGKKTSFLDNSPRKEIHLLKNSEFSKEAILILSRPMEGGGIKCLQCSGIGAVLKITSTGPAVMMSLNSIHLKEISSTFRGRIDFIYCVYGEQT